MMGSFTLPPGSFWIGNLGLPVPYATVNPMTLYPAPKPLVSYANPIWGSVVDDFDNKPFVNPLPGPGVYGMTHALAVVSRLTSPPYDPSLAGMPYLTIWFVNATDASKFLGQSVAGIVGSQFGRGTPRSGFSTPSLVGINSQNSIPWDIHVASELEFRTVYGGVK